MGAQIFEVLVADLHEGVPEDVSRRDTLIRLFMEQLLQEKSGWVANVVRELKFVEADCIVELAIVLPLEGELAA